MRKIIIILALAFAMVNFIIGLTMGADISAPSIVMPILLAIVMGLKKVTRKA